MNKNRQKEVIKRNKKKRNIKKIFIVIYRVLLLTLILVGGTYAVSIFFQISDIRVEGQTKYTQEEIIEVAGVQIEDNLIFAMDFMIRNKIMNTYPYVAEVKIVREFPDTLVISVTDGVPIATIRSGFDYYLIDINGKVLEEVEESEISNYINVNGVTLSNIKLGENIADRELAEIDTLISLFTIYEEKGILEFIDFVDLSKLYDIKFGYKERFTVEIGENEETERKIRFLISVEERLGQSDTGIINIRNVEEARFIPYS